MQMLDAGEAAQAGQPDPEALQLILESIRGETGDEDDDDEVSAAAEVEPQPKFSAQTLCCLAVKGAVGAKKRLSLTSH